MSERDYVRSAERTIPAPAATIFALLSDPERHPDIDGSGTVRRVEAGRTIAWRTRPLTMPLPLFIGGRIWRYVLEEVADGTHVVETWDLRPERNRALVRPLAGDPVADMQATLRRIEDLVT